MYKAYTYIIFYCQTVSMVQWLSSSTEQILLSALSFTKRQLLLFRENVNYSRHDIAEKLLNWRLTIFMHLLTHLLTHLNVPCMIYLVPILRSLAH